LRELFDDGVLFLDVIVNIGFAYGEINLAFCGVLLLFKIFLIFNNFRLVMVQVKWVKTYLDGNNQCNIDDGGTICGTNLTRSSSVVKKHVKVKHPALFERITGKDRFENSSALTTLAHFIGTTTAAINYLKNPAFKVSFFEGNIFVV